MCFYVCYITSHRAKTWDLSLDSSLWKELPRRLSEAKTGKWTYHKKKGSWYKGCTVSFLKRLKRSSAVENRLVTRWPPDVAIDWITNFPTNHLRRPHSGPTPSASVNPRQPDYYDCLLLGVLPRRRACRKHAVTRGSLPDESIPLKVDLGISDHLSCGLEALITRSDGETLAAHPRRFPLSLPSQTEVLMVLAVPWICHVFHSFLFWATLLVFHVFCRWHTILCDSVRETVRTKAQ